MTNIGRCRRASRSARSAAKAAPLANSSLWMGELAAGAMVTICMPSTVPVMAPPSTKALGPAAIMVSAAGALGGGGHRVTRGRGCADGHRCGDQPALDVTAVELAMRASAAAGHVDDVGDGAAVADVGVAGAVGPRPAFVTVTGLGTPTARPAASGIKSSVSWRSSSSGARMTRDSRSKAEMLEKSRSSRSPNSLNGMMSVTVVSLLGRPIRSQRLHVETSTNCAHPTEMSFSP